MDYRARRFVAPQCHQRVFGVSGEGAGLITVGLAGDWICRGRLARVNRALEKIADGTYGLSDMSGSPIPRERLEAIPDAVCTFEEESTYERQQSR